METSCAVRARAGDGRGDHCIHGTVCCWCGDKFEPEIDWDHGKFAPEEKLPEAVELPAPSVELRTEPADPRRLLAFDLECHSCGRKESVQVRYELRPGSPPEVQDSFLRSRIAAGFSREHAHCFLMKKG